MDNNEIFPLKSEYIKSKDMRRNISEYTAYWPLFIISSLILLIGAFGYLRYYAIPQYLVTSTLLINTESSLPVLPIAAVNSGAGLSGAKDLTNEVQVLTSRSLMEKVVDELSLSTTYHYKGRVRDIEVYGKSSPINIIVGHLDSTAYNKNIIISLQAGNKFILQDGINKSTYQLGKLITTTYGTFTVVATSHSAEGISSALPDVLVQFHDSRSVASQLSSVIKISQANKESTVLNVSITDAIPERGKNIINSLISVYDKEALEYKNRNIKNTISFLDNRLKFIIIELSGVEKNVEQYKRQNKVADVSTQASNYIEQASDYNKQLSEWAIQIDVLESIEKYLTRNTTQYNVVPSSLGIKDATLVNLIERFNTLQLERERMLRTTEVSNPLVQNLNEQLENLRSNILENLRNIKNSLAITSRNLKASSGQFQSEIKKVPSIERELIEINREQQIKQVLYSYLLQKREENALELASTVSNSRVIDSATNSNFPISPNKPLTYLTALLIGLCIPFIGIYIKGIFNDKIQSIHDVQELTKVPVLGEVAINSSGGKLAVTKESHSPIAEMFRLIRANFSFMMRNKENKVILITSSMSGEGKTFFSLNFAASLILTGKRVILIDLDLRNFSLSTILNIQDSLGVTDYLASNNTFVEDVIQPCKDVSGLYTIGAGHNSVNPSELMLGDRLSHLIDQLKDDFDYIILDTAPVGKVADVFSLTSIIDSCIYVVRCGYTYKRMLSVVNDIREFERLKNLMLVVNFAKPRDSYGYKSDKRRKTLAV